MKSRMILLAVAVLIFFATFLVFLDEFSILPPLPTGYYYIHPPSKGRTVTTHRSDLFPEVISLLPVDHPASVGNFQFDISSPE